MTQKLTLIDDTLTVLAIGPESMTCALAVRIEGLVGDVAFDALGPALNALYARALLAVYGDPTVQALTMGVYEGQPDGASLEIEVAFESFAAPSGGFTLHMTALYSQPVGAADRRQPLLEALTAALAAPLSPPSLSIRERAMAALQTHYATALATTVERNRDRPAVAGAVRTILRDGDHEVEAEEGPACSRYRCAFGLELFDPDSDVAALNVRVAAALVATAAADRLGGLVEDVQAEDLDPSILRQQYTGPAQAARLDGQFWFSTAAFDPTVAA